MLSYYKKAVKDSWKSPVYKAEVVLRGENKEQLTIPFEGGYYELILFIAKYLKFRITSSWKIYENDLELSTKKVWKLIEIAEGENNVNNS